MFVSSVFWVVCLASSTVLVASVLDKPYYDLKDSEALFRDYVKKYEKVYNRVEYLERLEIFKEKLHKINERNAKHPMTVFAINHFSDLKPEEMQQYRGFKLSNEKIKTVTIPDGPAAPDSLDWREQHVVSHVKDQGPCASCFIFSAIGNIEGQHAIKNKECLALSEGEALDCLPSGSCYGGRMEDVMNDIASTAGIEKEADYDYVPHRHPCHKDDSKAAVKVASGQVLTIPDEEVLKQKLADIGPLAVGLASQDLETYDEGILIPDLCKDGPVDHGALLVGYGEEKGTKYWIIKNSWGKSWGESGYVRLLRGVNACQMGTNYTAAATLA